MTHLKQIQAQIFQVGLHQNTDTLNKLMVFCTDPSLGNLLYAEKIFNCIECPNNFTYPFVLKVIGYLRELKEGEKVHGRMQQESNLRPDEATVVSTLSASRKIFDDMASKNVICWTSMVSGYVNCGQLDEARELFDRSPVRDIVLWTAMINGGEGICSDNCDCVWRGRSDIWNNNTKLAIVWMKICTKGRDLAEPKFEIIWDQLNPIKTRQKTQKKWH
ncbi:hypothetical protein Pint_01981 [Pistacia integerrima]|uniref:Uncharacterized protein n=1 Tax=Pistacia integerrima TaxID=434235 RepID=A0ACC0ZNS2_9ROSI|nr:hypothetical protein Pint_01981 [Pistacia integerrima]